MQGASLRVIWYIPEHLQGVVSSEELRDNFSDVGPQSIVSSWV